MSSRIATRALARIRFRHRGRTDPALWCRHEEHQGWVIVDADGQLIGWPLATSQSRDAPPEGLWVSANEGQSDLYDLAFIYDSSPS
jgi:hypothetical protein